MTLDTEVLLKRGYFPKESTPLFSSREFGAVATGLSVDYAEKTWTAPAEFNMVKPDSLRRRLSVPNPFSQRTLARLCSENWSVIDQHLSRSTISLTRPTTSTTGRALSFCTPYNQRSYENLRRLGRARYTVVTDISDYFGSIYTHSIEWALDSKEVAKANLRSGSARRNPSLGAKLDAAARNSQEGQTKGIAASPDTSLILSELVLCSIDLEIEAAIPGASLRCIRFMDDLLFAARSRAEAEDFVHIWETALGRYHLALNPRKTEILEGPPPPDPLWHVDLRQFRIRTTSEQATVSDIYGLASKAFTLVRGFPNESVLSYAVRKIDPKHLAGRSWTTFEDFLYSAAVAEPASIDKVVRVLASAISSGKPVDRDRAGEVFNEICEYHAPLERGLQTTWAMVMLMLLGRPISSAVAEKVSKMQDNSSLLLLFNCIDLGIVDGGPPDMTTALARAEDPSAPTSEDWLLGYECSRNAWSNPQNFKSLPHWDELLQLNVAFFDPLPPSGAAATPSATSPSTPDSSSDTETSTTDAATDNTGPEPTEPFDAITGEPDAGDGLRYP